MALFLCQWMVFRKEPWMAFCKTKNILTTEVTEDTEVLLFVLRTKQYKEVFSVSSVTSVVNKSFKN